MPAPLLAAVAMAADYGVVVRFQATSVATGTDVVATLTFPDGSRVDAPLHDDGSPPDEKAMDGAWSGAVSVKADAVRVDLTTGTTHWAAGTVSWTPGATMRELTLVEEGGHVTARASVAAALGGAGDAPSVDRVAWVELVAGVAALAVVGGAWVWTGRPGAGRLLPVGLRVLPPAPLVGDDPTRPAGAGPWVTDDLPAALAAVVTWAAPRRRLLVVAPATVPLPPQPSGPVLRMAPDDAPTVLAVAEALRQETVGSLVVVVGVDTAALHLAERLGPTTLVLTTPTLRPDGRRLVGGPDGWVLGDGDAAVRLGA